MRLRTSHTLARAFSVAAPSDEPPFAMPFGLVSALLLLLLLLRGALEPKRTEASAGWRTRSEGDEVDGAGGAPDDERAYSAITL